MNWLAVPFAVVGLAYLAIAVGWLGRAPHEDRGEAITDLALRSAIGCCALVAVFAAGLVL